MNNTASITHAAISSDASISISVSGQRSPSYNYVCNVPSGQTIYNTWRYLVWFIEDIKVNNTAVLFNAPAVLYDSVAMGGYFTVDKSEWIDGGKTLVIVGRDLVRGIRESSCRPGATYNFSSSFKGKPVGIALPAGTHMLTFNLRVMRIQDSGDAQHAYNLAISNRARSQPTTLSAPISISSYCTNNNVSSVTLAHGSFAAGTGNGQEASATVEYECNLKTSKPQITFTGADVISGNQVKICDGLFSVLSATTDKTQGYNFKTVFKSTLSGNASSSCVGAFSKNAVAVISPP
ncbi:hypothetical protein KSU16_24670 [Escherichia coli]|uniref:hypothetical protein n=1 Tax=Escherichia coli TaxID=562 RepID=UPI0021D26EC1|nr:hypothetical protein [Escherichia coli]MCU6345187.1 hypothetical protein [Escherichia coli]